MTLEEIEAALQARLDHLAKMNAEGFESPPFVEWLRCYEVLAQVKQAQALETISGMLDEFRINGFPIDSHFLSS